ncbi:Hok/Gef family protein [Escherichia sp. 79.0191]|uniref:Hok/Gef family protein n=1 Tax=Escherichia sp. 79.0191 TaxID=2730947 RepID=UPI00404022FB
MKLPGNALIWCVLIVCCTLLIFTLLTRNRLCEVRLPDINCCGFRLPSCFSIWSVLKPLR